MLILAVDLTTIRQWLNNPDSRAYHALMWIETTKNGRLLYWSRVSKNPFIVIPHPAGFGMT